MRKIYIFGASKAGVSMHNKLKNKYDIIGFIDNNDKLWGKDLHGKKIYPPSILYDSGSNIKIIIASMYYKEISEQLDNMGIKNYTYFHQKYIGDKSKYDIIRILICPLTLLFSMPVRLIQILISSLDMVKNREGNYISFVPHTAINSLFYSTEAINLYKYGRNGRSPCVGLGDYPLFKWFHLTRPSLYLYHKLGAIIPIIGIYGWVVSHVIWINEIDFGWILLIMALLFISTTVYANAFSLQNYNALGWLFFPIGLYGLLMQQWKVAMIIWIVISFNSFTVTFIAGLCSLFIAINTMDIMPIVVMIPSGIKLLTHFIYQIDKIKENCIYIMKAIGMTDKKVKYRRSKSKKITKHDIVYLILYVQYSFITYIRTGELPILFLFGVLIYITNVCKFRFADKQSMYMLMASFATINIIFNQDIIILISFWVMISPLPYYAGFPGVYTLDTVPPLKPVDVKPLIDRMQEFLHSVKSDERILMAFNNPNGIYDDVFDGYRVLLELPLYVSTLRQIHFMPDWWGVFQTNYIGAPEFWGRDIKSIKHNIKYWDAQYALIYQQQETEIDSKWEKAGFTVVSKFCWSDFERQLMISKNNIKLPNWWLLKITNTN